MSNFADVFRKRHKDILLNSPDEFAPLKRKKSILYLYWSMRIKRRLHHNRYRAVRSLSGDMERVCAFFMP